MLGLLGFLQDFVLFLAVGAALAIAVFLFTVAHVGVRRASEQVRARRRMQRMRHAPLPPYGRGTPVKWRRPKARAS